MTVEHDVVACRVGAVQCCSSHWESFYLVTVNGNMGGVYWFEYSASVRHSCEKNAIFHLLC